MYLSEIKAHLVDFEIACCSLSNSGDMAFVIQNWGNQDSLELHQTEICIYMPQRKEENQWHILNIGDFYEMFIVPSNLKDENWVAGSDLGDIFTIRKNEAEFEKPIASLSPCVWGANNINGSAFFVGSSRNVVQRVSQNNYIKLPSSKLQSQHLTIKKLGFNYIDGFSSSEIYACGGSGDLWKFDGNDWNPIDLPTNLPIRGMCCGTNGLVYILVARRFLYVGRDNCWDKVAFEDLKKQISHIFWYRNQLILLTENVCYEYSNSQLVESDVFAQNPLNDYMQISVNKEKILLTSINEATFFDGQEWSKVI